jgi:hypothetical protein
MRYITVVNTALAAALGAMASVGALAQSTPLLRTVAKHVGQPEFEVETHRFQCPAGHIPMSFSFTPRMPYEQWLENERALVDRTGAKQARNALTSAAALDGGGISLNIYNIDCHLKEWVASLNCLSNASSTDNAPVLAKASTTAARAATGQAMAFCPADSPVALGGFSNADGTVLQDVVSAPVWGTAASPTLLADQPDGQTGPPTGWQVKVTNTGMSTLEVDSYAVCGKAPTLQTFVYSATVPAGTFGTKTPFSVFGPVPDGWTAVGTGFDTGPSATFKSLDMWNQDSVLINMMVWYSTYGDYNSGSSEVRAFMVNANGDAPAGSAPRAVMAVLATQKPAPPPTQTTVVEFYHQALDHYFITGIAKEISDLDTGVHAGWMRTGQTFKAYAIGSAGRTGRRPVCRAYGIPSAGIDSHFYSASPDECTATMVNFGDAWQRPGSWGIEASEVFQMDLPDPLTGACPANGVPIYRVFNQRKDANHRYTTSLAIRDQMVAKGGVAEGYGPNAVALCGLP